MNYESMSDFEINKAVANVINNVNHDGSDFERFFADVRICELENGSFNPCNNPADAWSIMLKNGITPLAENGIIYGATTDTYEYYEPRGNVIYSYEDKNPLRAAMIVFLMMSES